MRLINPLSATAKSDYMFSGFGVRYGKNSSADEMAGGRRKSARQKRTRRANAVDAA